MSTTEMAGQEATSPEAILWPAKSQSRSNDTSESDRFVKEKGIL